MKGKIFPEVNAMDWIDCFPIFVLDVIYKSSFLGHIMYFNYLLDQHLGNNSEKCLATPSCASGRQIKITGL